MPSYQNQQRNGGRQDGDKPGRTGGRKKTSTATSSKKKDEAPTVNHRTIFFTAGKTNKEAAGYSDTVRILARHVSTSSTYRHGSTLANAMVDLVEPVSVEPPRPVRKYYRNTDDTSTDIVTDRMTSGKVNETVQDDSDWSIEVDQYKRLLPSVAE